MKRPSGRLPFLWQLPILLLVLVSSSPAAAFAPTVSKVRLVQHGRSVASSWDRIPARKDWTSLYTEAVEENEGETPEESSGMLENYDDSLTAFDYKTTLTMVGGQSLLIAGSVVVALLLGTPNWGLGPDVAFSAQAWKQGILLTAPLGAIAVTLEWLEPKFPALQDVSKATQRSVLALLGGTFRPAIALLTAVALGLAAGFGEEMLFRGILQFELAGRLGSNAIAVALSSLIFGALHAVTPLYALLAGVASIYFGGIYLATKNLAIPIVCHAVYDVVALLAAHWTVARMSDKEQREIALWQGPEISE